MEKELKIIDTTLKNINKIMLIVELFMSIVLAKEILEIYTTKMYNAYIPLNKLIILMISGIIVIFIIIYTSIKNSKNVEKLFVTFAIPVSICYAIFMLPFNVPDEGTHFIKAYDIACGNLFSRIDDDGNSYSVAIKELENYSYKRFQNYQNVYDELNKTTNYEDETKIICAAQGNSPVLYAGTAVAIKICKIINVNIFYALYFGRIINAIIFILFGYLSIKKIPFGKILLAISLIMPMMMQQAASCSSDAILNSILIYYIAFLLNLVYKKDKIIVKEKIGLYVLTALVAMFKYIYILLAGILFVKAFNKKGERAEYVKTIAVMILIGSIFSIGWFIFTSRYNSIPDVVVEYNKQANVDSGKQLEYIKENPIEFLKTFTNEYFKYGINYILDAIGLTLGWLNVNVNLGIIVIYLILLIIATISEENNNQFNIKFKIWILFLIFAISALLNIAMYIGFTPVGLERICGVQGRYYTPVLFLILMCLIKKHNNWKVKNLYEKMIIISTILNVCTLFCVIQNYI